MAVETRSSKNKKNKLSDYELEVVDILLLLSKTKYETFDTEVLSDNILNSNKITKKTKYNLRSQKNENFKI
jgi:hypothetical protein